MIKTHLADSDSPLKEGSKLLAICGAFIPDAAFLIEWDENFRGALTETINRMSGLCSKCRKQYPSLQGRYVYGIYCGEEALHDGSVIDKAVEQVVLAEKRSQQ